MFEIVDKFLGVDQETGILYYILEDEKSGTFIGTFYQIIANFKIKKVRISNSPLISGFRGSHIVTTISYFYLGPEVAAGLKSSHAPWRRPPAPGHAPQPEQQQGQPHHHTTHPLILLSPM